MLVLSQKRQESIWICDDIVVTVLAIRGNKVRLGIEAPKEIHVLRTELQNVISESSTGFVPAAVAVVPTV
jgi:carbon storage regulator